MNIIDWFDIDNIEHLKAYRHMQNTGMWPKGFLPKNCGFSRPLWDSTLRGRMAERFIEEKLGIE